MAGTNDELMLSMSSRHFTQSYRYSDSGMSPSLFAIDLLFRDVLLGLGLSRRVQNSLDRKFRHNERSQQTHTTIHPGV